MVRFLSEEDRLKKIRRQARDALNKTSNIGKLLLVAKILEVKIEPKKS